MYSVGLGLAVRAFAVDQAPKAAALVAPPALARALTRGVEVLPFLDLVLVHNRSMRPLAADPADRHDNGGAAGVADAGTGSGQAAALSLIIGGALRNLVDRLHHGVVADFLVFHAQGYHLPTFNLAGSGIVLGVVLLLIVELRASMSRELSGRENKVPRTQPSRMGGAFYRPVSTTREVFMRKTIALPVIMLAGVLATASAFAQGTAAPQGSMPGMQQMPMMQGQGGMMMNCPMMQRMASLDQRVRQLEERAGIPAPTQPGTPATPR